MRAPWKLWVTLILSAILTLMAVRGSANALEVVNATGSYPLPVEKWVDILSRPLIVFLFSALLLWGIINKHRIAYWLTIVFWVVAVTYQVSYMFVSFTKENATVSNMDWSAFLEVNSAILVFFSYMLLTCALTKRIKNYFRKERANAA